MILNAVSRATAGALRVAKPSLLQNEVAKVSSILAVNSKYIFCDLSPFNQHRLNRSHDSIFAVYCLFFARMTYVPQEIEQFRILNDPLVYDN